MRHLEILLSFINLLTFFVFVIPLPGALFWMRYLAPLALLIAVSQILMEGSRWQMVPAYALAYGAHLPLRHRSANAKPMWRAVPGSVGTVLVCYFR